MIRAEGKLEVVISCRGLPRDVGALKGERKVSQAKLFDDLLRQPRPFGLLRFRLVLVLVQAFFLTASTISSMMSRTGA